MFGLGGVTRKYLGALGGNCLTHTSTSAVP